MDHKVTMFDCTALGKLAQYIVQQSATEVDSDSHEVGADFGENKKRKRVQAESEGEKTCKKIRRGRDMNSTQEDDDKGESHLKKEVWTAPSADNGQRNGGSQDKEQAESGAQKMKDRLVSNLDVKKEEDHVSPNYDGLEQDTDNISSDEKYLEDADGAMRGFMTWMAEGLRESEASCWQESETALQSQSEATDLSGYDHLSRSPRSKLSGLPESESSRSASNCSSKTVQQVGEFELTKATPECRKKEIDNDDSSEANYESWKDGSIQKVPEIEDEFCDLVPEIEDEFWDGDPVYENSTLGRKEGNSAWMDSFGIKCKQCSVISENRREFKKHLQVSPICYESSFSLTTPSQKFRYETDLTDKTRI